MSIVERIANITDLDFIHGCILYGARKGHYSFNAENPEIVKSMKHEMQSVVNRQLLLDQRRALASIFMQNNKRVAMLIMSEAASTETGVEIYALSVVRKYQNKGYASRIVDALLSRHQSSAIYARCSPSSEKMSALLLRRGFEFNSMDDDYKIFLRHPLDVIDSVYLTSLNYLKMSAEKNMSKLSIS
ncbi:MAG: GNAT family N-acetyltransferase [Gammaproteobacteria bacterium]|nr:GNAT family N-acetyltransferase [Gammaproteobacteria bacterium]MCW8910939.1 GNAT family N-acetyltransferase [Gammaproteobacteria bacterium]MCW9006078.1 GNAT family N-acetyltransferase [Gammaproteobacteria bacterium]MCW9056884.1 GNAT family N-acetyltransferase [Gammaproteobacteria bacterium]